jgi:hypothetical protein
VSSGCNQKCPLAGFGPAIHDVLMQPKAVPLDDVDARAKPGQGDVWGIMEREPNGTLLSKLNQTTFSLARE